MSMWCPGDVQLRDDIPWVLGHYSEAIVRLFDYYTDYLHFIAANDWAGDGASIM